MKIRSFAVGLMRLRRVGEKVAVTRCRRGRFTSFHFTTEQGTEAKQGRPILTRSSFSLANLGSKEGAPIYQKRKALPLAGEAIDLNVAAAWGDVAESAQQLQSGAARPRSKCA